jgi:hypothetical protein
MKVPEGYALRPSPTGRLHGRFPAFGAGDPLPGVAWPQMLQEGALMYFSFAFVAQTICDSTTACANDMS